MNSRARKWALRGLLALAPILLLETAARVAYTVVSDTRTGPESASWVRYSPRVGWETRPGFQGEVNGMARKFAANGFLAVDAPQATRLDATKIVFLGDSNTFGYTVRTEETFVELLDRALPDVEAINLGVVGYSSYQGLITLFEKALPLEPDILVVSFNFNDRRYVLSVDDQDSAERFNRVYASHTLWAEWTTRLLDSMYIARGCRALLRWIGVPDSQGGGATIPAQVAVDTLLPRVSPAAYRQHLRQMAKAVTERGIGLVFIIFDDNPVRAEYYRNGARLLEDEHYDEAIQALQGALRKRRPEAPVTDNPSADLARLKLVEALSGSSRTEEARAAAVLDRVLISLHGGTPIRPATEYHEIMREVAGEFGAELVDAAAALALTPSDYIGWCHFDAEGHRKVAALLEERVKVLLAE